MPDRADRVNDMAGKQTITPGELGVTRLAAAQPAALLQQFRPCGPVNRAIHAAAAQQRRIRGVDDRARRQRGDVGLQRAQDSGNGPDRKVLNQG